MGGGREERVPVRAQPDRLRPHPAGRRLLLADADAAGPRGRLLRPGRTAGRGGRTHGQSARPGLAPGRHAGHADGPAQLPVPAAQPGAALPAVGGALPAQHGARRGQPLAAHALPLLFLLCAGNEGFHCCLYLLYWGEGPRAFPAGPGLFRLLLWLSAPLAALKSFLNLLQLGGALRGVAALDAAERARKGS
uniref:Uncharacterized protein n=1 Tax=Geospiza parvula TaxID=87175 RepID=A0A8C3MPJ6_GEOPR